MKKNQLKYKKGISVNMSFKSFIKDKLLTISLMLFGIATIEIFLIVYPFSNFLKIYIPVIIFGLYSISILIEYMYKKKYYNNIFKLLDELEEKYLITEVMPKTDFLERKMLKEILGQIDKSMLENVNKYKHLQEEYKEYIEMWIHEIKIPIATSYMIIENNKTDVTKNISEELEKVENYIEQDKFKRYSK